MKSSDSLVSEHGSRTLRERFGFLKFMMCDLWLHCGVGFYLLFGFVGGQRMFPSVTDGSLDGCVRRILDGS